ncbi:MAG TPA: glycosyltransferase family 2 protein [Aliidongia sp.]|nr:glycosyltransferase family 2 protein [Aliidongia sp.]
MISMVVPTRNRAHTLRKVAPSYFSQDLVSEILFVIDQGEDETPELIAELARQYPAVRAQVIRNATRQGASQSRNIGVAQATNEFILFCDDDEYLEPGYAKTCLDKLNGFGAGAVSGRRVYMRSGETPDEALRRFGDGLRRAAPFNHAICEYVNGARFGGDLKLPFTNAIILTRRDLLQRFPFDPYYARGNGYREETDYQMNLFVNGFDIYVTNDCHSIHLPLSEVKTGGQRTRPFKRIYWSVFYTRYFFDKYFDQYAARVRLGIPKAAALAMFAGFAVYRELLRPSLHSLALAMMRKGT